MTSSRVIASQIIAKLIKQQLSLDSLLESIAEQKEISFIKELCFGTLRYYHKLNKIAELLLNKALPSKCFDIHCLLVCGLYQIIYLKTPAHAAVSESVNAAVALKKPWAKGLINKTLRLFIEQHALFLEKANQSEEGLYSHPQWLIGKIKKAYPENYSTIFERNNQRAPLTLRVNQQKISTRDYLKILNEESIKAQLIEFVPSAIQLETPIPVSQIPGFFAGLCSVQDLAGQLAAFILNPQAHQTILDACAAPGSKTTHLLETQADLARLYALDISSERLNKLNENIHRLQLDASKITVITQDASQDFSLGPFDSILLDAPCSGTGVIRRHPDIKVLRHPEDVAQHVKLQAQLLKNLWPLVKEGGQLLYSTCSILMEENEKLVLRFLASHPDAQSIPLKLPLGTPLKHGLQILPGDHEADGFYYCLLRKKPS